MRNGRSVASGARFISGGRRVPPMTALLKTCQTGDWGRSDEALYWEHRSRKGQTMTGFVMYHKEMEETYG